MLNLFSFFLKCNFLFFQGGSIDLSFFSPDCFHFSKKGQSAAGLSLWNNMVKYFKWLNYIYLSIFNYFCWGMRLDIHVLSLFQWTKVILFFIPGCNCCLWISLIYGELTHIIKMKINLINPSTCILLQSNFVKYHKSFQDFDFLCNRYA